MICPQNGDCMMNSKIHTDVDFCVSPRCIYPRKERMLIAQKISNILKKSEQDEKDELEIKRLKILYAESLKRGG